VEEEKVVTWPDSEVQLIIEEKNKLEDEVRYGQIQRLKLQVGALVDVTSDAMEKLITLDKAPPQLEVLMGQMVLCEYTQSARIHTVSLHSWHNFTKRHARFASTPTVRRLRSWHQRQWQKASIYHAHACVLALPRTFLSCVHTQTNTHTNECI